MEKKNRDGHRRGQKSLEGQVHTGDKISYLVVQCFHIEEEVRKIVYVHRLHRSQQSLPEGTLPITTY